MQTTCQKTSDGWPSKPELDAKLLEKVKQESASLLEIAQLLVQGASCNALDFLGRSVLHWAVQQDNFALGSLLIDFGASVDLVDNTNTLPLHVAAGVCQSGQLAWLLMESKGGKILSQNSNGWTTLHIAAFVGNAVVLRMLVSSHVDLEVCDIEGSKITFVSYFDADF
jgi:ankyrin repeat protein